jgi:hypothetical protein
MVKIPGFLSWRLTASIRWPADGRQAEVEFQHSVLDCQVQFLQHEVRRYLWHPIRPLYRGAGHPPVSALGMKAFRVQFHNESKLYVCVGEKGECR